MTTTPAPSERLARVCSVAGLDPLAAPQRIESNSNDAWSLDDARLGQLVLRVCWRGDIDRLGREVTVARHMPASIRYPEVAGHGRTSLDGFDLSYSLTRRLTGRSIEREVASMDGAERRSAVAQLADMLADLHRWVPSADLAGPLVARPDLAHGGISGLLGADITPLPVVRALDLAAHATSLPHVDPCLMSDAVQILRTLRDLEQPVDDPSAHGLIHGDLDLSNLLWSDSDVVLLDLEWVRFGPPLLDLQRLCDHADVDMMNGVDTHPTLLRWLESDYPELFRCPHAAARMRLYALVFAVRHVIVDPPDRDAADLPPDHAIHRIRRLVDDSWPEPGSLPDSLMP